MRRLSAVVLLTCAFAAPAFAQLPDDMSCADYTKMNKELEAQMTAADKAALTGDADAAKLDQKMKDYCAKNPAAKVSEAMEKAMMN